MNDEQIRYWDEVIAKMVQLPEWKQDLDAKLVENTYLNSRDTRKPGCLRSLASSQRVMPKNT